MVFRVEDKLREFLKSLGAGACLPERLKIYAPTCYGRCVLEVEELADRVARVTGGATIYDGYGWWLNEETGEMVKEPVKVIEAGHNCLKKEDAEKIIQAVIDYAKKANQQSIAIFKSNFYIASTDKLIKAYERFTSERRGFRILA